MIWLNLPKQNSDTSGETLYADILNHCKNYKPFLVAGSKITSAHEVSHGIASEIRNSHTDLGKINGFYLGENKAIILGEPNFRKRDVAERVPGSLRGYRYSLYMTGSSAWDAQPLYVLDEHVAYLNGTKTAVDLKRKENHVETGRVIDGQVEFNAYAVAILMTAVEKGCLEVPLREFCLWLLDESYAAYGEVMKTFSQEDPAYRKQKECREFTSFLKDKFDYEIPEVG